MESVRVSAPAIQSGALRFSVPRVAIVHYWLLTMRGGERVVERILRQFPQADIFTHVYDPARLSGSLRAANVTTTFIDRLPMAKRFYQYYLPLMPMALEELDLSGYDLVISSEAGPSKGVITSPSSTHICYCHSPMRYLWDQYPGYKQAANPVARLAMPYMYHRLRQWDVSSANRVDGFVANSRFIRDRIRKVWRRESEVIHPPVETDLFEPTTDVGNEFLWVGQMVPYKRPDIAVEAFNASGLPLLMVGQGQMLGALKAMAKPNVRFIDRLDFPTLRRTYAQARAFVMTAEEDFGIAPVEAMASGRPVIAYGRGGALDSVVEGRTGIFFDRQDAQSLQAAVERFADFEKHFEAIDCVAHARLFAPAEFDRKFAQFVAEQMA